MVSVRASDSHAITSTGKDRSSSPTRTRSPSRSRAAVATRTLQFQANTWSVFIVLRAVPSHIDPSDISMDEFEAGCLIWIQSTAERLRNWRRQVQSGHPQGGVVAKVDQIHTMPIREVTVPPEVASARQMQAAVAGYQARRYTRDVKTAESESAAMVIQAGFRGGAERDAMARWEESAQVLQAGIDGFQTRNWISTALSQMVSPDKLTSPYDMHERADLPLSSAQLKNKSRMAAERKKEELEAAKMTVKANEYRVSSRCEACTCHSHQFLMVQVMEEATQVLAKLREMFYAVDTDGSGDLTLKELAVVMRGWYRENKMARSIKSAEEEMAKVTQDDVLTPLR